MKIPFDNQWSVLVLTILVLGCIPAGATAAEDVPDELGPLELVVSILPLAWFAEQIGQDKVRVAVLVGPGQSPATFDPTARQMATLQDADLFFSAGVPFERGLMPKIKRMSGGPVAVGSLPEHSGHDHGELDPHTWLDPGQARIQADLMCAALCRARPSSASFFQARRDELRLSLDKLDQDIRALLAPYRGREFIVFHPAFGHFAEAYGLNQISIESGGHEPGARHLAEIIDRARQTGASAIIVQPQFSRKSALAVARSLKAEVVALDPLARDYESNLMKIATTLRDIFELRDQQNSLLESAP